MAGQRQFDGRWQSRSQHQTGPTSGSTASPIRSKPSFSESVWKRLALVTCEPALSDSSALGYPHKSCRHCRGITSAFEGRKGEVRDSTTPSASGGAVKLHVPMMTSFPRSTARYPVQGGVAPVRWSNATSCWPTERRRSGPAPRVSMCSVAKAAGSSSTCVHAI